MDTKEDTESQEDREKIEQPQSPYVVLQHVSDEAFKIAAGDTVHAADQPLQPVPPMHRRCQSETVTPGHTRNSSFQKLKSQVQKAWPWGGSSRDQDYCFNPEVLANQKRLWYQLHSKALDHTKFNEANSLYEHFVIVGLHPDTNLEAVEDVFARRKKWEFEASRSDLIAYKKLQSQGPKFPLMEPQILFKYPPGKRLHLRLKDLCSFCFPDGVKTRLLEKTPSLSELSELIFGQEHMGRDDLAFIFSLKVADNDTLYGVCLHVTEAVQRSPSILGNIAPLRPPTGQSCRFLVSAPRCYCLLTRVPFFELHFEMLNSIIAQERLNRATQFASELLPSCIPPAPKPHDDQMNSKDLYNDKDSGFDWTASAIPINNAVALAAAAAGMVPDEIPNLSPKTYEPNSPESGTTSDASDLGHVREVDKEHSPSDGKKNANYFDDCASESSETRYDALERMDGSYENSLASSDIGIYNCSRSDKLERLGSFDSIFSPARSVGSPEEDEELFPNCEKDLDDGLIMGWAREHKNEPLQIVCGYHSLPLPERGSEVVYQPLEHLQAIKYRRPTTSGLHFSQFSDNCVMSEVNLKLASAEEAHALSIWTTATICRVLSLESILTILTGVLLEKQVVVVCPNLGVLSAVVLSVVPMIRPFQWQSLFLPVLPARMLDFLDAPVPYIVGIQQKPEDLKMRTSNLIHVNVLKNQVKMCNLPALPRYRELISRLSPFHARLSFESGIAKKLPVYRCNEVQAEAATHFLAVLRQYLESICSDLRSHTITSVQSNNDRVCLLLKDSFIDSFPVRDRPFIKLFVDTQLFAVLSDNRLSSFESGIP
ncbi:DENN (AEX-3) domain-containing protein [Euphorbia peplus]|nr:DENN (AEX-3) domain-containing protein [Euphorbia peplus]